MFAKHMTAGLVGTALLATAAFAQAPTATTDRANAATNPPIIARCNLENALRQLERRTP